VAEQGIGVARVCAAGAPECSGDGVEEIRPWGEGQDGWYGSDLDAGRGEGGGRKGRGGKKIRFRLRR